LGFNEKRKFLCWFFIFNFKVPKHYEQEIITFPRPQKSPTQNKSKQFFRNNKKQRKPPESGLEPLPKKKQKVAKEEKINNTKEKKTKTRESKKASNKKEKNLLVEPEFHECQEDFIPSFKKKLYGTIPPEYVQETEDMKILIPSPSKIFNSEEASPVEENYLFKNFYLKDDIEENFLIGSLSPQYEIFLSDGSEHDIFAGK